MGSKIFVGVDPGASGGAVALSEGGGIVAMGKFDGVGQGASVGKVIATARAVGTIHMIGVEKVGAAPGQGVSSMFTFGQGVGNIKGWLEALSCPFIEVHPMTWQKVIRGGDGSTAKDRAKTAAAALWGLDVFITPGCRVPHSGLIDAALIAEYLRAADMAGQEVKAPKSKVRRSEIRL